MNILLGGRNLDDTVDQVIEWEGDTENKGRETGRAGERARMKMGRYIISEDGEIHGVEEREREGFGILWCEKQDLGLLLFILG